MRKKTPSPDATLSVIGLCAEKIWSGHALSRWIYMPFGLVLACLRLVAVIFLSTLSWPLALPLKRVIYRALLAIMGIKIKCRLTPEEVGKHTDGCVIASNHISVFDHFPVLAMPHATVMVANADSPIGLATAYLLFQCSGASFWKARDKRQLVRHFCNWRKTPQGIALYTTPEATINNGRALFRFRPEFLTRGRPVVPLAMKLNAPFGLTPNPLSSSGAMKFLRLLMMPWLEFEMTFLERQTPAENQTGQAFADQVQACVAAHLAIPATRWTRDDKYAFRDTREQQRLSR